MNIRNFRITFISFIFIEDFPIVSTVSLVVNERRLPIRRYRTQKEKIPLKDEQKRKDHISRIEKKLKKRTKLK